MAGVEEKVDYAEAFAYGGVLEPTAIFAVPKRSEGRPEVRLVEAVLLDAAKTLLHVVGGQLTGTWVRKDLQEEAVLVRRWVRDEREDYVFSFNSCCLIVDLDPSYIRKRLLEDLESYVREVIEARGRKPSISLARTDPRGFRHQVGLRGRDRNGRKEGVRKCGGYSALQ